MSPYVTSVYKITIPWKAKLKGCPVNNTNQDAWMEFQCKCAEARYVTVNLLDLQEKVHYASVTQFCSCAHLLQINKNEPKQSKPNGPHKKKYDYTALSAKLPVPHRSPNASQRGDYIPYSSAKAVLYLYHMG
jgi:hypothetical protein